MDIAHLAAGALRAALMLALALAAVRLLGRAPAALKRLVLVVGLGAALLAPALAVAIPPAWRVEAAPRALLLGMPVAEAPFEGSGADAAGASAAPSAVEGSRAPVGTHGWRTAVVALWAAGFLLVLGRLAHGMARAGAIARRATPVQGDGWGAAIAGAERSLGCRARVRESDEVDAPAVTGIVSPVVLVPRAARTWSDARKRLVLLHELAHVRQMDCLAQAIAQLACAVHWFDPLAWLAARRLRLEREVSADDAVVAAGVRPSTYAEELLEIAGIGAPTRNVPSGALCMARSSELGARLAAVLGPDRARAPVSIVRRAVVVALGVLTAVAAACASPDRGAEPAVSPSGQPDARPSRASSAPMGGSTLRPALQAIADEEIGRLELEWQPAAAAIVVLDPASGEIVANAGRVRGTPTDVAAARAFPPGSTLKTLTIAAALDERVVSASQRFDCRPRSWGERTMSDAKASDTLDVTEILTVSSNTGTSRVFDALGGERLGAWLRRFHLGEPARAAGDGAVAGQLPERIEDASFEGALVAMGARITASPMRMAAAYAAIANQGVYMPPTLARADRAAGQRVLSAETARAVLTMLEAAVHAERATGKAARVDGVRVAGKTGTAELSAPVAAPARYASFVGIVPADRPRFVILVGAEVMRDEANGPKVAAPVFARVASRALASE